MLRINRYKILLTEKQTTGKKQKQEVTKRQNENTKICTIFSRQNGNLRNIGESLSNITYTRLTCCKMSFWFQ